MPVTYRKFKPTDEKAISQLMLALHQEDEGEKPLPPEHIRRTLKELYRHSQKGTILVIKKNSELIGYAILINFWSNEYGGNVLALDELYIKPKHRNQGIGSAFIQYLANHKFNYSIAIELEATKNNHQAQKLYQRLGFQPSKNYHYIYHYES